MMPGLDYIQVSEVLHVLDDKPGLYEYTVKAVFSK